MATYQVGAKSDAKFDLLDFFASFNRVIIQDGAEFNPIFYDPNFLAYAYLDGGYYEKFEFKITDDGGPIQGTLKGLHVDSYTFIDYANNEGDQAEFLLETFLFNGDDTLKGGAKADVLRGFGGEDKITGGKGADQLYGGDDDDTFIFKAGDTGKNMASADRIHDFERGDDQIDLSAIDANSQKGGNQAFKFIGAHDFKHAGDLHFDKGNGFVTVSGDTNGDGKADFMIRVDVGTIGKGDFDL